MSNFVNIRLDNLVETRKLLGYNQEYIASYLSYDRSYYSKIENVIWYYSKDDLFVIDVKRKLLKI